VCSRSQKFVCGEIVKFEAESGEEVLGKGQQARGSGGSCSPVGLGQSPDSFERIESLENASSGHKCRSVLVFSIRFGGTLGYHWWNP